MGKSLYSKPTYFKLISGNQSVIIDEPINWDKIDIMVPRDQVYFGFVAEFISDEISLQWPESDRAAFDFIKGVYDFNGGDGNVILEFGFLESAYQDWKYRGNLNLNTYVKEYQRGQFMITCSVAKLSFENLFRTRFDSNIDFSKDKNLDGGPISQPAPISVLLHSRQITKEFKSFTTEPRSVNSYSPSLGLARFLNVQFDVSDSQVAELQGGQGLPLSLSGVDPRESSLFSFGVVEAGAYAISLKASFHTLVRTANPLANVGSFYCVPRLMVVRGGNTIEYTEFDAFKVSGAGGSNQVEFDINFEIQGLKRNWQIGDQVYIGFVGVMGTEGAEYYYFITNYTSEISIVGETVAENTTVNFYRAFDVLTKAVEYATGRPNAVISSILGPGGELYRAALANGYSIRNFQASDKPFITSIKDFFESIFAMRGLGYGIKRVNGLDYLVVEQLAYFYQNREIIKLDSVFDYREEHAKDKTYNEYDVGYTKFPDSDANTLDEYNTYQTGLFPIKTYKAKFVKKSTYITAGYSIEIHRREQFKQNPSESLSNDDAIFFVYIIEGRIKYVTDFKAFSSGGIINCKKALEYAEVGSAMLCERGGGNHFNTGKAFTITAINPQVDGTINYIVTGDPLINESGRGVFSFDMGSEIRAEKNEMFYGLEGVLSPDTVYNLRYTPRRILFNWSPFLNIGLAKKGLFEIIVNTFMKNNSKLVCQLDPFDPFADNYSIGDYVYESKDLFMFEFNIEKNAALHQPQYAFFKSEISFDEFLYIRDRLTGDAGDENDRGYISHPNPEANNQMVKSFIYSIKYTPKTRIAEMQVAKIN